MAPARSRPRPASSVVPLRVRVEALDGADHQLEQRRLADAVGADDRELVAAVHVEVEPLEDDLPVLPLAERLVAPRPCAARRARSAFELEAHERPHEARPLRALGLDTSSSFSICFTRDCACLLLDGVRPEAVDELLQVVDLLLGRGVLRLGAGAVLVLGVDEVVVAAGVDGDGLVVDVGDVRGDGVQEVAVVRDDDERPLVLVGQEALEPADGVEVEVVGRLVEQQDVGAAEEHLRDEDAQLVAGRQGAHRVLVALGREPEAHEQLGRRRSRPRNRSPRRSSPRARPGAGRPRRSRRPRAASPSRACAAQSALLPIMTASRSRSLS